MKELLSILKSFHGQLENLRKRSECIRVRERIKDIEIELIAEIDSIEERIPE